MPRVFTIPPSVGFAETLARGVVERVGVSPLAIADVTIYLPTRRSARTLGDAFAQILGGASLLPDFRPLGDVDDEEVFFSHQLTSVRALPAIPPLRRRLLLATLVRRWFRAQRDESISFARAIALADGLAALLDEAETQGADLERLDDLVGGALARHWSQVRDFLQLLRDEWPKIMASEGAVGPAERRNAAILSLAEQTRQAGERFILAAGSTGSRRDVVDWIRVSPRNAPREYLLREVLRPPPTTDAWRRVAEDDTSSMADGLKGLSLLETADPAEESTAIALMLRESLEHENRHAALVTTDRGLARRVAAELRRWDIDIDDSGGLPLARTPPGMFLCLVAEAAEARFAPVPLLSVLRHPLASPDRARDEFLRRTRTLDKELRGPRPDPGLKGVTERLADRSSLVSWFAGIANLLRPLETLIEAETASLADLIDAHVTAAQLLAGGVGGLSPLWEGEAGDVARAMTDQLSKAAVGIPPIETRSYAALFRDIAESTPVRPQRRRHPRLAILGPLEARLQSFDLAILGGLNEGSWPRPANSDPWLSRPMREAVGLESPERTIGLAAHDFATLGSQPRVIFTRAGKADGAPTVPSRWIQRLQQFLKGLNLDAALAPEIDWCAMARALNSTDGTQRPATRPSPMPPIEVRPRRLSITEIEKWRRDPYAIYARHILSLRELDELDAPVGPLERGDIVHRALETFIRRFPLDLPVTAVTELIEIAEALFKEERIPKAVMATWRPRFAHAAAWFVGQERERRATLATIFTEVQGEMCISGPAGAFRIHGRADRIDVLRRGGAAIIDYKTGSIPTDKQVRELLAPQLPIEAAMLAAGGFPTVGTMEPKELVYVRFSGGAEAGSWKPLKIGGAEAAEIALALLTRYVVAFDDPTKGYVSRAIPFRSDLVGTYDHLARYGEWTAAVIEDVEE